MMNVSGKAHNMLIHTTNKNVVCDVSRVLTLRVEREHFHLPACCMLLLRGRRAQTLQWLVNCHLSLTEWGKFTGSTVY